MHYLDTSVLVAAVTSEPSNAHVLQWMRDHDDSLAISNWTQTEISAALSLKVRTFQITPVEHATGLQQIEALLNTVLISAPIDDAHFFAARHFAGRVDTGLRAGDALHVAIAADHKMTLVTLDKKMAVGADFLGLDVVLLSSGASSGSDR